MTDKIILVFIVLIFGFLGFILFQATDTYKSPGDVDIVLLEKSDCDLQANDCSFEHPELGQVIVSILPRPIKMNVPLKVKVKSLENIIEGSVDFFGLEMNMGFNRPPFLQSPGQELIANALLPTCTQRQMTWQATVILKAKEKYFGKPFRFITVRD